MADLPTNVALVYDRVNKWGGAENVLLALREIFPKAPIFTTVYNPRSAPWANTFVKIQPSFIQYLPYAKNHHEYYAWLTPLAFETFNFSDYQAIISVTSADAKGIITQPSVFHLCYCLTPTRYLWSHNETYTRNLPPFLIQPLFKYLRSWDLIASKRPDQFVAISKTVQSRLKKYYSLDAPIIYPPIIFNHKTDTKRQLPNSNYFLWVGRLVSYKRPDLIIQIFNELKLPLVIVGQGHEFNYLQSIAKSNIYFAGFVSEDDLASYYQYCQALVSVHEEDFGLVYLEAQSFGKPVIALNTGGVSEVVISGRTGLLLDNIADLKSAIKSFDPGRFHSQIIKRHTALFNKQRFQKEFLKLFQNSWTTYKNTYMS